MIKTKRLQDYFDISTEKHPDAIAISTPITQLTYRELGLLANQLAKKLIALQVKPNQLIAVVMEKGWEQVVAVLGVLKSGAAYLPIDPNESTERLHYLLEIGEVQIVLTQDKYQSCSAWPSENTILSVSSLMLDESDQSLHLPSPQNPDDLAYVVFTSGSTGTPKGVMISHRAAMNTIFDINARFSVDERDKIFAISALTFDLSVYDIFGALAVGGTIVMTDPLDSADPTRWDDIFFKEKVSVWDSVPALMDIFVEYVSHKYTRIPDHGLRLVLLSGDWIPLNLPQKIRDLFGPVDVISLGGATEASIWSILYPIHDVDPDWKSIPYGKPMKNQSFHILNEALNPVPQGERGALFIGGEGVAKGYWRDKKRTAAQFIQHPRYGFIYKTGDLGRYLPDGNIEFLGRIDFQVKIAGYRIEVNAIEKYLLDFPGVKQALVLPIEEGHRQKLAAYLILKDNLPISEKTSTGAIEAEQVQYWQKVYDELCPANGCQIVDDPHFNTAGWVSSYLNEPIPKIQMQAWVDQTVERILSLQPQSILEIGCGTGLLLFRLAPEMDCYEGTDFSSNTLQYVQQELTLLKLPQVTLTQCEATGTKSLLKTYDVVILNSVIQYFPSVNYLLDALKQSISKVRPGGYVFIGDIISLPHLRAFHASVLLSKATQTVSYLEWKALVHRSVEEENELAIDANFFYALQKVESRISHVEILIKAGKFRNEMTNFRYDVILYIDHTIDKPTETLIWHDWQQETLQLPTLHTILSENQPTYFAIKNIPNQRVAGISEILNNHFSPEVDWQNACKNCVAKAKTQAIAPEVMYEIAADHGYHASMAWSNENPSDDFQVLFRKKSLSERMNRDYLGFLQNPQPEIKMAWEDYANKPLLSRIHRHCIAKIKGFLRAHLPHYMIPNYFTLLKELPISANGKIDRKALPKILYPLCKENYILAKTPTQKKLVAIWKEMLGINQIGIHHNFYDMGGTSLLSVQLIVEIENVFNVELSVHEIVTIAPTIEKLGSLIEEKRKLKSAVV